MVVGYETAPDKEDVADVDVTALGGGADVNSLGKTAGAERGEGDFVAGCKDDQVVSPVGMSG